MALVYCRSFVKAISSSILTQCPSGLWRRLTDHGISRVKPTGRVCLGGQRKRIGIHYRVSQDQQRDFTSLSGLNSSNLSVFNISTMSTGNLEGDALLHNTSRQLLNIQFNTSASISWAEGSREKFMGQQQSNNKLCAERRAGCGISGRTRSQ